MPNGKIWGRRIGAARLGPSHHHYGNGRKECLIIRVSRAILQVQPRTLPHLSNAANNMTNKDSKRPYWESSRKSVHFKNELKCVERIGTR